MFQPPEAQENGGGASQGTDNGSGAAIQQPTSEQAGTGAEQNQTAPQQPQSNQSSGETQPQQPQTPLKSREISYSAGAWKIYGTLYESKSKTPTRAIVLLPALGKTRDSYPVSFIERLYDQFPESIIIALDPRGHGKSTNLGTYEDFDIYGFKDMKTDITYLKKSVVEPGYPNIESFYIIGASIGSTTAVMAGAQESQVHKIVMISPGMSYQGVDISRALDDYPHDLLAVASSGDSYSAQSASSILSQHGATHTEVKTYSGSAHGTDLFSATEGQTDSLTSVILEFLK